MMAKVGGGRWRKRRDDDVIFEISELFRGQQPVRPWAWPAHLPGFRNHFKSFLIIKNQLSSSFRCIRKRETLYTTQYAHGLRTYLDLKIIFNHF